MNKRELSTVLAALRYWQHERNVRPDDIPSQIDFIATDGDTIESLLADEIDALCERLNTEEPIKIVVEIANDSVIHLTANREAVEVLLVDYDGDSGSWTHSLDDPDQGFQRLRGAAEFSPDRVELFENAFPIETLEP